MISLEEAIKIINKANPESKIVSGKEFSDHFLFVVVPKNANPDTWISGPTIISKKDGKISYGDSFNGDKGVDLDLSEIKHSDYLTHHNIQPQYVYIFGSKSGTLSHAKSINK